MSTSNPISPWDGIIISNEVPPDLADPEVEIQENIDEDPEVENPEPEEDNNDPEPEVEEKEPNPHFYFSHKLKSEGLLPDDFEPTEDVSAIDVYTAYGKKLRDELEPQIRNEVISQLESQGITENDLVMARAIRSGVDLNLLSEAGVYERFSSIDEDASNEEKMAALKAMYKVRRFSDREIENLMKTAVDEYGDVLSDSLEEAKAFHTSKWKEFRKQEQDRVHAEEEDRKKYIENAERIVKKVLTEKNIMGEPIDVEEAKIIRDAIYSPSETIEYGGNTYKVSKLYNFNQLFETSPEFKLWLFKKYLLKDRDLNTVKKEIDKQKEDDMLKAYEQSVKQDLLRRQQKEVNKKIQEEVKKEKVTQNGRTYMIEL